MITLVLKSSVLILVGILLALSVSHALEPPEMKLRHSGLMLHGSGSTSAKSPDHQVQHEKLRLHRASHHTAAKSKAGHEGKAPGGMECCDGSSLLSQCPLELTDVASQLVRPTGFYYRISYLDAKEGQRLSGIVLDKLHDPPRPAQS